MTSETLHASAVSFSDKAVLILGPSGSGKSALALELIALDGDLVADDHVKLTLEKDKVMVGRPQSLPPWIEARGIGLLQAPMADAPRSVVLVVDMGDVEQDRLPEPRSHSLLGQSIPLLHKVEARYFPSAIKTYLVHGIAPL